MVTQKKPGFCFLGIITITIGVILLILACLQFILYPQSYFLSECDAAFRKLKLAHEFATENPSSETKFYSLKLAFCDIPITLLVLGLGIFALVVSSQGGGKDIPGRSYKEYHFESYSKWMKHKVGDNNWNSYYKKDVVKEYVCNKMIYDYSFDSFDAFNKRSLDSLESSCCKPPEECNFNYTRPTVWVKSPENENNYTNSDCNQWDNDVHSLCFNCNSCKAAFLENVTHQYAIAGSGLLSLGAKQIGSGIFFFFEFIHLTSRMQYVLDTPSVLY